MISQVLLSRLRDGAEWKQSKHLGGGHSNVDLSLKVLLWFGAAIEQFPSARFVGKSDMDAFVVWPNVRTALIRSELLANGSRFIMAGRYG